MRRRPGRPSPSCRTHVYGHFCCPAPSLLPYQRSLRFCFRAVMTLIRDKPRRYKRRSSRRWSKTTVSYRARPSSGNSRRGTVVAFLPFPPSTPPPPPPPPTPSSDRSAAATERPPRTARQCYIYSTTALSPPDLRYVHYVQYQAELQRYGYIRAFCGPWPPPSPLPSKCAERARLTMATPQLGRGWRPHHLRFPLTCLHLHGKVSLRRPLRLYSVRTLTISAVPPPAPGASLPDASYVTYDGTVSKSSAQTRRTGTTACLPCPPSAA